MKKFGIVVSGAMDIFSLNLANILVGNNINEACLEATVLGPELKYKAKYINSNYCEETFYLLLMELV